MNRSISLVLCSCDKYEDTWEAFCSNLKQFWPEFDLDIYLCTESKSFSYQDLRVKSPLSSLSFDKTSWSRRLYKLLEVIPSDYVLFFLDDFILTSKVDNNFFLSVADYVISSKDIGYLCCISQANKLATSQIEDFFEVSNNEFIFNCRKKRPYRITTQAGIWNRKYFMSLLRCHESAWQFEIWSNFRSRFYRSKVCEVKESIFNYPSGGLIWRGKCLKENICKYDSELIKPIIDKRGIISLDEFRQEAKTKTRSYSISHLISFLKSINLLHF